MTKKPKSASSETEKKPKSPPKQKGGVAGFADFLKTKISNGETDPDVLASEARQNYPAASPLWTTRAVAKALRRHAEAEEREAQRAEKLAAKEAKEKAKAEAKAKKGEATA